MPAAESLGTLAVAVLNGATAFAVGAALAGAWLARTSPGGPGATNTLRRTLLAALLVAIPASAAILWCEAAVMAEVPLSGAGSALSLVISGTHYGLAWCIGFGALASAALIQLARARWTNWATLLLVGIFLYTRSMVSHAASDGDLSVAILADWLHLLSVNAWVGPVAVSGLLVLPRARDAGQAGIAGFAQALSGTATVALGGIVLTGLFNAWHNLGGAGQALGSDYAGLLLLKIVLVLVAAALGGINRLFVMTGLLDSQAGTDAAQRSLGTFIRILRVEAVLLGLVLAVAAVLSSTPPPMAG